MKAGRAIILFFLLSGCVGSQLGSNDILTCLDATHVSVTRIPACENDATCQTAFLNEVGAIHVNDAMTQQALFRMEQGMVSGWENVNQARAELQAARDACRGTDVTRVVERGLGGASALKRGLREYERTMESARIALAVAAEYGNASGLEHVRDTNAFEAYARILEIGQEWSSGEATHPETNAIQKNKAFFDRMGTVLARREIGTYSVQWTGMFRVYETILKKVAPDEAPVIALFSPVWQSAVSTYSLTSRAREGVELLNEVRADELIEHMEEGLAVENGIAYRIRKRIGELEKGIVELGKEEIVKRNENRDQLEKWSEEIQTLIEIQKGAESWIHEVDTLHQMDGWDSEREVTAKRIIALREREKEIERKRVEGTGSLGARVAAQRELGKEIAHERENAAREKAEWEKKIEKCEERVGSRTGEMDLRARAWECEQRVEAIRQEQAKIGAKTEDAARVRLNECVNELTQIANAMGVEGEETDESYFVLNFGLNAGVPACVSRLQSRKGLYVESDHVQEWASARDQIEQYVRAWNYAHTIHAEWTSVEEEKGVREIEKRVRETPHYVTREWVLDQREWGAGALDQLQRILGSVIQAQLDSIAWKWIGPENVRTNEDRMVELEFEWENPFGGEVELNHVFRIGTPIGFETLAESGGREGVGTLEWSSLGAIWEVQKIPDGRVQWRGVGRGVVATQEERNTRIIVIGTRAEVERIIDVNTNVHGVRAEWRWMSPPGANKSSVRVRNERGELLESEWSGNELGGVLTAPGRIVIQYDWPNAIVVEIQNEEGEGEYRMYIRSNVDEEVRTTLFTGITADPLHTEFVDIREEGGIALGFSRSVGNAIVLNEMTLAPLQERIVTIRIVQQGGIDAWRAIGTTLVEEAEELKAKGTGSIRLQAMRLSAEIQSGWNTRSESEWLREVPRWQSELAAISREWETWNDERIRLRGEWEAIRHEWEKRILEGGDLILQEWWEVGLRAQEEENLVQWNRAVVEVKKRVAEKEVLEKKGLSSDEGGGVDVLHRIVEANRVLRASTDAYENAMRPGCEKLDQVGFTCPIGLKEWKEWDAQQKEWAREIEKEEKKGETKNESERIAWVSERKAEWEKWEIEMKNGIELMERGLDSIEATASELMRELNEKEPWSSEEVRGAVGKARGAIGKGEFGKAIFIAQNLRAYWGETALGGWNTIPVAGWALLAMGGASVAWMFLRGQKKNAVVPVTPVSIPRVSEEEAMRVRLVEPQPDGGGGFRSMRGETQVVHRGSASRGTRRPRGREASERGKVSQG